MIKHTTITESTMVHAVFRGKTMCDCVKTLYAFTTTFIKPTLSAPLRQSVRVISFALISSHFYPEEVWPWLLLVDNDSY